MTSKSDFTPEEWKLILEAPPSAGMIVVTAQRGGSFRETIAMAKAYVEARQQHGNSELLDDIVAAKPERDHTHSHSVEDLKAAWAATPARVRHPAAGQGDAGGGRRVPTVHRQPVATMWPPPTGSTVTT